MRTGIRIEVSAADAKRLEAIVIARGSAQKHVWRARIILLTAQGLGTQAIMAATPSVLGTGAAGCILGASDLTGAGALNGEP